MSWIFWVKKNGSAFVKDITLHILIQIICLLILNVSKSWNAFTIFMFISCFICTSTSNKQHDISKHLQWKDLYSVIFKNGFLKYYIWFFPLTCTYMVKNVLTGTYFQFKELWVETKQGCIVFFSNYYCFLKRNHEKLNDTWHTSQENVEEPGFIKPHPILTY